MSNQSRVCIRCYKSHLANSILLSCSECHRNWHYNCHIPPIPEAELIARIKATNANDVDNGLDGWTCKRCMKGKQKQRELDSGPPTAVVVKKSLSTEPLIRVDQRSANSSSTNPSLGGNAESPGLSHETSRVRNEASLPVQVSLQPTQISPATSEVDIAINSSSSQAMPTSDRTAESPSNSVSAPSHSLLSKSNYNDETMDIDTTPPMSENPLPPVSAIPAKTTSQIPTFHESIPPETTSNHASGHERMDEDGGNNDDDMESLYWNPPPGLRTTPALPNAGATTEDRSPIPDITSYPPRPSAIAPIPPPDSGLNIELEPEFEPTVDVSNRHIEGSDQLLTSWMLARYIDEDNPWSPFLGIKCSHRARRPARTKIRAVQWEQTNRLREDLVKFTLTEWVVSHQR